MWNVNYSILTCRLGNCFTEYQHDMIVMTKWLCDGYLTQAAYQWEIYLRNTIVWDNNIYGQLIFELADEYYKIFNVINNIYLKGIFIFCKIKVF